MKIGQVIRRRRRAAKMTLEALAARAGTDAAGLSRVERGLQGYTPEGLAAIAEALGATQAELMTEAEETNTMKYTVTERIPNDEQELLLDYRKLRSSARSLVKLIIAEMAKTGGPPSNVHQ